ncbi:MAG: hypothetical protein A2505_01230 [Deltaproteobacteria bacterium RIFOXYD12_FULL_55_16]|nr:MAG: hypothetical protein A2505_01230 [Deltaproteobacteria bacterium RIFOXYD12_FULL_55_16]
MMGTGYWAGGPGCFFGWPLGMILGIIFWGALIYGIFLLFSRLAKRRARDGEKEETPLDILKKRYARGEIDAEEFGQRKKNLES